MLPKTGIKWRSRQVCLQDHRGKQSQAPTSVSLNRPPQCTKSMVFCFNSMVFPGSLINLCMKFSFLQPRFAGLNFSSSKCRGNFLFLQDLRFELGAVDPCGPRELGTGMGHPSSGTAPCLPSEHGSSKTEQAAAPALAVRFLSA